MEDYQGLVAQVLSRFTSPVVPAAQEEAAKAQLTRLAVLEINRLNPDIGLVTKTSGNNIYGMSVDLLLNRTTGEFVDMASATSVDVPAGHRRITTVWVVKVGMDLIPKWVQPTAALAALAGPMVLHAAAEPLPEPPIPDPTEPPLPEPVGDTPTELALLVIAQAILAESQKQTAILEGIRRDLTNTGKLLGEALAGGQLGGLLGGILRRDKP